MLELKMIKKIEDITEINVKYCTMDNDNPKWFSILKDKEGYNIYGYISGDTPTFVSKHSYVHFWQTLKGVIKAIKRFAKDGSWGFGNYFPDEKKI